MNRVFGIRSRDVIRTTLTEMILATLFGLFFLLSIFLTAILHTAIDISEGFAVTQWSISYLIAILLGLVATILPVTLTALIFTIVYRNLPNAAVEWRDATFGALIAIVLFEIGKHILSFWFTGVVSQGGAVYGPIASFVVLLMWAYIAGLIFLYGTAVTKVSSDIRPRGFLRSRP